MDVACVWFFQYPGQEYGREPSEGGEVARWHQYTVALAFVSGQPTGAISKEGFCLFVRSFVLHLFFEVACGPELSSLAAWSPYGFSTLSPFCLLYVVSEEMYFGILKSCPDFIFIFHTKALLALRRAICLKDM